MVKKSKEKKILSTIEKITGEKTERKEEIKLETEKSPRKFFIQKILIFSSSYDYFLLEEEGRLKNLFSDLYSHTESIETPSITHVEDEQECLKKLSKEKFDLLLIFDKPKGKKNLLSFSKKIKTIQDIEMVLLSNDLKYLKKISKKDKDNLFMNFFTWNGDGRIILDIVQYVEDSKNLDIIKGDEEFKVVLLVEDSIQFYSKYLTIIHEEIKEFLNRIINQDLDENQKNLRFLRKPFIILASNLKKAEEMFSRFEDNICCIITDNHLGEGNKEIKNAGLKLTKKIKKQKPELPILIQSSEPLEKKEINLKNIEFTSKYAADISEVIKKFIRKKIGPTEISIINKNKETKIKNLDDLQNFLLSSDDESIYEISKGKTFSEWLYSIGEFELSKIISYHEDNDKDSDLLKKNLLDCLEDYKYSLNQLAIKRFQRIEKEDEVKIRSIGKGALGGKARGIAFISKIFKKYLSNSLFRNLSITVPRTVVLSTDVFDKFLNQNDLLKGDILNLSDERIAAKFIEADLPATILGDVRSFIRKTRKPLIIRSSGVLEDSLFQPFAGVYASMFLPNESWETDLRFKEVCNAIKYIYASTYFRKARNY
ncbi:MAG: PEP/pyruvate-binding domain-containing protein, partial [Candidatus Thermoplasmatota archaeon]